MGGVEWWGGGEKSHILHSVKCFTHSPHRTRRTQQGGRNVKQVGLSMRGFPARSRPETRRPSPLIINGAGRRQDASEGGGDGQVRKKWASARLPASHFISCWFPCRFFLWPSARDEAISRSDIWRLSCAAADSESANAKRWCTCFVQVALHAENM